jgi:hypothetical protein
MTQACTACNMKIITAVINSLAQYACIKWLTITNTLAYYATQLITAIIGFMTQALGDCIIKLITAVTNSVALYASVFV